MATKKLSQARFVTRGYGQVEPNHLSAKHDGNIHAQLPADPSINILENGMFAKYDYAHGVVTFGTATVGGTGNAGGASAGDWMLVLNEVELYRDYETFEDYAMMKSEFNTRMYSPIGQSNSTLNVVMDYSAHAAAGGYPAGIQEANRLDDRSADWKTVVPAFQYGVNMPAGSTMTPRLFGTKVGDLYTTNTIDVDAADVTLGMLLVPGTKGYLVKEGDTDADTTTMRWQVVKVYTLPNNLPAVKLQRVA